MKKRILLFLLPLFFSCSDDDFSNNRDNKDNVISIYVVKEGQIENFQTDVDLESLELEETPWLQSSEIELYDWSSHIFYLNTGKERSKYEGRHFVIKSGDTPVALGLFFSSLWSYMPTFPSILAHDHLFYPEDVIGLAGHAFTPEANSPEEIQRLREALESSGILYEGLDVKMLQLDRKNSTTLTYTIQLTNNDSEDIYILDPDKMGTGRFHYYTNGVSLRKENDSYSSFSDKVAPSEIKSSWYYKLVPKKSITRTITLDGFSDLPSGEVHFYFSYPGANNIDEGEWEKSGGRIWMGSKFIEGEINLN